MLRRLLTEEESTCGCAVRPEPRQEQIAPHSGCHRVSGGEALAMVYSPCQSWCGIYDPETALRRGTLFKALDKPFEAKGWGNRCGAVRGGCGCGK
ncbi:MAG: spore coat associated protein CotJA [Ruminococcaceae bacterium]|nr:spore coat associated protein CotJA [Oscillospiraceae bacterium]